MSALTICDICNKPLPQTSKSTHRRIEIKHPETDLVYKELDAHEKCVGGLLTWMQQQREKAGKFKAIEEIRAGR